MLIVDFFFYIFIFLLLFFLLYYYFFNFLFHFSVLFCFVCVGDGHVDVVDNGRTCFSFYLGQILAAYGRYRQGIKSALSYSFPEYLSLFVKLKRYLYIYYLAFMCISFYACTCMCLCFLLSYVLDF